MFCNGDLWNYTLSWNTSNPNLTPCLRDAVCPSISCGFLWLCLPFWYYSIVKGSSSKLQTSTKSWTQRLTLAFMTKLTLTIVILSSSAGELAWRILYYEDLFGSDLYYPVSIFFTTLMALVVLIGEKIYLRRSSQVLSIFWPLLALSIIPNFKVEVEYLMSNWNLSRMVLTSSLITCCILLTICHLWADMEDLEPRFNISPMNTNSFFSAVFLSWMTPLIWKGYKQPLSQDELYEIPSKVNVDENNKTFQREWKSYLVKNGIDFAKKDGKKANLWIPLARTVGWRLLFANALAIIHYSVTFFGPQVLKQLIALVEDPDDFAWKGYLFSVVLFVIYSTSTIFFTNYLMQMYSVAIAARSVVISAIMRKMLKLSNNARKKFTIGQITNLVSVDAQRCLEAIPYLCILWSAPYQATLGMILVYKELGIPALAGAAVLVVLVPLNAITSKLGQLLQASQLKAKDSRIKVMNEILSGIKVLKLYAWEIPFMKRILDTRAKEIRIIRKYGLLNAFNNFTYSCSPIMITFAAFSAYALTEGNVLTPQKIFVSMAYFNLIRIPLMLFPITLREVIKLYVSMQRIAEFMNAQELSTDTIIETVEDHKNVIELKDASMAWDEERITLQNMSFNVPKGSLTAIIGAVGSGKSSVLSGILGEMELVNGTVCKSGSIAYVAQQAWIQNLSLRNNVLFGRDFNQELYKKVIAACSLQSDLKILAKGDATEIGENGINLSGGQKQRVNLARAVYSNSDLYLLDDPLSAVDAHVGKHIFEQVISSDGLLGGKTRLWVTNNLSYLPLVDQIIILDDGKIIECGSYRDLIRSNSLKALQQLDQERRLTEASVEESPKVEVETKEEIIEENNKEDEEDDGKLIKEETSETGRVKLKVFLSYFKSLGYVFTIICVSLICLQESLHLIGNVWLANWSDDNVVIEREEQDVSYYLLVYGLIGVTEMILKFGNEAVYFYKCATASEIIHKNLLNNIMRCPMNFFDTNPTGRILNRFTSDLDTIDQNIPPEILDFTTCLIECVVIILLICVTTPAFIIVIIPLMGLYFFIQRIYIASSRQLKRLYSISKSPIYSHFSETINGAQTVRAYGHQPRFILESQKRVATNVNSVFLNFMSNRWLGMRLEMIGNLVIFFAAMFAMLARDSLSPGQAGLSITSSLQIIGALVWVVRMACQLETDCVAIERVVEYAEVEQEASWTDSSTKVSTEWPDHGKIHFQEYETRYREGLDLVLKGVDLEIKPDEKVGICGRTGAGKSSLTLALFRIIEPVSGKIFIDNQDIVHLGLHQLRSRLTIIPQDPVLFTGDLRFNLDPIGGKSDEQIWKSLEQAHLKKHVIENLQNGLDSEVTEMGGNFSVGQRQLICLARALLRKTKILVLDEATAAVDQETDELIQSTLRREFSNCTVLTIAHRLNTIMDSDRIVVLKEGKIEEMGSPSELLNQNESVFKSMAQDSNLF